jgi:hypothetical protein
LMCFFAASHFYVLCFDVLHAVVLHFVVFNFVRRF